MGLNNDKGKVFEQKVAGMIRRKVDPGAKRNNGSHANWHRRSDIFTNLPFHIEAKDQETLKPKEWFRQAEAAASFSQIPIVAFHMDEEVMSLLRLDDVLNLLVEIADLKLEVEDLRQPVPTVQPAGGTGHTVAVIKTPGQAQEAVAAATQTTQRPVTTCRAGHIADEYGYCMQVDCRHSRGYKPPKKERKS